MTAAPTADLAVRKRRLVRSELAEAAVTLLADQAFVETTFDQIVAAVGMSRRTFSRY
jgi:AcrR family transcriptional regulator